MQSCDLFQTPLVLSELKRVICMCIIANITSSGSDNSSMPSDIQKDIMLRLRFNLDKIMDKYSYFVEGIRKALNEKGISAGDLCSFLLSKPVFNYDEQNYKLFQERKEDLENAVDVNRIFNLLHDYCSFLNYEIFLSIAIRFDICKSKEEMDYPEHLKDYINMHKVEEFIKLNPVLLPHVSSSKLTLKLNIEQTTRLAHMKNIADAICYIMKWEPSTVRILGIEEGCVALTLLIPTFLANIVFTGRTTWTDAQRSKFEELKIMSITCNGYNYHFSGVKQVTEQFGIVMPVLCD